MSEDEAVKFGCTYVLSNRPDFYSVAIVNLALSRAQFYQNISFDLQIV